MEAIEKIKTKWPETTVLIRFSDCDLFGHLSNITYLKYFMDAREDHLMEAYDMSLNGFARQGIGWVVSSNQISYFRSANVNEKVVIRSAVVDFSPNHILVEMHMLDENKTHIKAALWSKFVHVSMKDGRKTEHSQELMDFFADIRHRDIPADFGARMNELKAMKF